LSVIQAIYKAPVKIVSQGSDSMIVAITYQNQDYWGWSSLHPDDKDFFSEKVGYNIAKSRARKKALKAEKIKIEKELRIKKQLYSEIINQKNPAEVDPTGAMRHNIEHCEARLKALRSAISAEEVNFHNYLEGQAKAISSVKRMREKANNN
jgi:hypothetical protein